MLWIREMQVNVIVTNTAFVTCNFKWNSFQASIIKNVEKLQLPTLRLNIANRVQLVNSQKPCEYTLNTHNIASEL